MRASADAERQAAWLQEDVAMGFTRIYLHDVNPDQQPFFGGCAPRFLRVVGAP